jgi:hypothetical protein
MPFKIVVKRPNLPDSFLSIGATEMEFESGADAANQVQREKECPLLAGSNLSYRIVRVDDDESDSDSWKDREKARIENGDYNLAPWYSESWYQDSVYFDSHFTHMSKDKSGLIAYTESPEKGKQDIQKRIRPGRYLSQYFASELNPDTIKFWAGKVSIESGESQDVKFATTPDEIEHVYCNGPSSCMSHDADRYSSPFHPTRVYGAGDLAVAYLEREDSITARALCWPDKKVYGRVYGDGGIWSTQFRELLDIMGFRAKCSGDDFEGARLIRHEHGDGFVAPYLDVCSNLTDDGEFLRLNHRGDICAHNESGVTEDEYDSHCESCENGFHSDTGGGYLNDVHMRLCEECFNEIAIYCEDCDQYHHQDNSYYLEFCGRSVCDSCASSYPTCDSCNERKNEINMATTADGEPICNSCLDDYSHCDSCNELYHVDKITRVEKTDDYVCGDCLSYNYSECDSCGEYDSDNDIHYVKGESICNDCMDDYPKCESCGDRDKSENMQETPDGDSVCQDCYENPKLPLQNPDNPDEIWDIAFSVLKIERKRESI